MIDDAVDGGAKLVVADGYLFSQVVYEKQKKFDKRDDKIKEALAVMESLNLKNTKFYEDTKNMMK